MNQTTKLSNNIRVITRELKDRDSAAVGIWVGVGGRYEEDKNKGAAHFMEHMAFKGSQKYSCDEIKQLIEGVGGALNAFTSEEQTCYYSKVPVKFLPRAFDILADMAFFPKIDPADMEKERAVILEEIKMYHDLPQYYVIELLDGLLWPDHPLGKSLAGTAQSVGAMNRDDLKNFHQSFYVPGNIVVSGCGSLKHEVLVGLVQKKLAKIHGKKDRNYIKTTNGRLEPASRFYRKEIEQMHLAIGMRGYETNHKDLYVLAILNIILGGNMSSRLFNEVREKHGLAYSISSSMKSLDDTGVFMIRAGVDNKKIVQAVELILKELTKIRQNGVTPDEFKRAKDYFLGQFLLGLEDTLDHMLWIGEAIISNDKVHTLKDVVRKVKKVTPADVARVAEEILDQSRFKLSIVGPLNDEQEKELQQYLIRA